MTERPNILLIMTDQQRGDCLGAEGHPALLTPHMDEIALNGAHFHHAYSTCPSCIPARRSLLTGLAPATHGLVGFEEGVPFYPAATLPGTLSQAGYQSVLIGRAMHQFPRRKRFGYDQMVLTEDIPPIPTGPDEDYAHGLSGNGWTARSWHLDESLHPTTRTADEAVRFLKEYRDPSCPFFLTVSFLAPHPPLCPPAFYMDRYLRMDLPEPAMGDWARPPQGLFGVDSDHVRLKGEVLRSCQAAYYGMINHVDDQICRVLRALGINPITGTAALENTLIIFTSDHGEMLGDHGLYRKCYPYEGSARIPFLLRGKGINPGTHYHQPVCLEDLMPTILDYAGVAIPDGLDGRSLMPLLRGESNEWRDYLHGEHGVCYGKHQANHYLTDGHEKYVWYSHSGEEQFFDLDADPTELHNLAIVPAQTERLEHWRNRLIKDLRTRPEGFSDGNKLIAGRPHQAQMPARPSSSNSQ